MKIVIVGPGAMGCLFAYHLFDSGQEVWLLDKSEDRAARLNAGGIYVKAQAGEMKCNPRATSDIKDIGKAELVIICVKSYDTKAAMMLAKGAVGEETSVLTLQNGIGNIEIISEIVGADKVIGGITNQGATLFDIGSIRHAGKGETIIGRVDGRIPVVMRSIREVFNKSGIETKISKDIKGVLWSKLIINAGINPLTAVTRLNNGKLLDYEGTRRIMRDAVTEAVRVAKRKRIKLAYDDPLAKVEAVCEATAANVSSMLQDVLRKKRTEIDFINGVIVRFGKEQGIPVPVNTILVDLIKIIESSYDYAL